MREKPFASPGEALAHILETPWSAYSKSDYTLEQWHAACLIHIHEGEPTSKSDCKLPVKTPAGALNRNGVHAAAAALAGARGGLKNVSDEQRENAATALRRYYKQMDEDLPESLTQSNLAHYGKKGMKWGVRNEDEPVGRDSSGKVTSTTGRDSSGKVPVTTKSAKAAEYHRLASKIADQAGVDSQSMAAKYGPPDMIGASEKQRQADREKLKKIAIGVGIGVGVAGLGIAAYKLNQSGIDINKLSPEDIKLQGSVRAKQAKLRELVNTSNKAYRNSADGLHINWDNGVDLPKGSIVRRLSSVAETAPRPEGFYAAHLDTDVESYKAILPSFWGQWRVGSAEAGGFLNHYMAKDAVRAPSGKESFGLFKKLVDTDDNFNNHFVSFWDSKGARGMSEDRLKKLFVDSSINWADPPANNAFTRHWFKALQDNGYNAVIDFNDAGKLGKTPLRLLDGNMFDIVKNESQSLDDFYAAAKNWAPELVHIYMLADGERVLIHFDEFLKIANQGREAIISGRIDLTS